MVLLIQAFSTSSENMGSKSDELFSLLLRLHPVEEGLVLPGAGNQVQAAFLDVIRQADPALAESLHAPNQRRPYTLSLLRGFNSLSAEQLAEARTKHQPVRVTPEQTYWLRITMLDATIFGAFAQCLIARPHMLLFHLGKAQFKISRVLGTPEPGSAAPWVAYSSFSELARSRVAQKVYDFEFVTPTAFSVGQKAWGKMLKVFPEPVYVFEGLARQWELFAPSHLRVEASGLTPKALATWCEEQVIVTRYAFETQYLPSSKFGQTGFQGRITYEVKGLDSMPLPLEATWLTPLARFALFCGIGYKTTMGMGQARCTNILSTTP